MPTATAFEEIFRGAFRWSAFSPHHKVELSSNLVRAGGRWFLFDPIPLCDDVRARLLALAPVSAIVLTNANHARDSARWQKLTGATLHVPRQMAAEVPAAEPLPVGRTHWRGWELEPLDGGAPGETAFRLRESSLVVLGDAMFHLPKHGLDVLPEKYSRDHLGLRRQLRAFCADPFDCALFAHGSPLRHDASQQMARKLS